MNRSLLTPSSTPVEPLPAEDLHQQPLATSLTTRLHGSDFPYCATTPSPNLMPDRPSPACPVDLQSVGPTGQLHSAPRQQRLTRRSGGVFAAATFELCISARRELLRA